MCPDLHRLTLAASSALEKALEVIADLRSGVAVHVSVAILRAVSDSRLVALVTALRGARLEGDAESMRITVLANVPRFILWREGVLDRGETEAVRQTLILAAEVFGRSEPVTHIREACGE